MLALMQNFEILPVVNEGLAPLTQAVMYEKTAAKYVMLGIHEFRKLVDEGVIPCRFHPGRTRRIYLRSDLDRYLSNLPCGSIEAGRVCLDSERN
jgi:excisionase family DNA binding protein